MHPCAARELMPRPALAAPAGGAWGHRVLCSHPVPVAWRWEARSRVLPLLRPRSVQAQCRSRRGTARAVLCFQCPAGTSPSRSLFDRPTIADVWPAVKTAGRFRQEQFHDCRTGGLLPLHPGRVAVSLPPPEAIESLARQVAEPAGLEVRGIHLLSHRLPLTVQVFVQRADGSDVSLEQCAAVSGPLGEALEAASLLGGAYVLEVSSPGVGEDLGSDRDFTSFRGFPVEVVFRESGGREQRREGLLLGRDEQMVLLNVRGRTVRIPRQEVLQVRLVTPASDG